MHDRSDAPVLVTGALGFVGRHLVRSLLRDGVPVVGADLRPAGGPPRELAGRRLQGADEALPGAVAYAGDGGRCVLVELDLTDRAATGALLQRLRPAAVYHLAAQSSAADSFRDPRRTFAVNVTGTLNLLEAARELPAADRPTLLNIGSSEEYGPQPGPGAPLREDAPLNPISPYAVSKVAQTLLGVQYARGWGLPVIVTRSFSHTGPGQDERFAFPSFARQIARAEAGLAPPELAVGDLSAVRDFLDVRDVVRAYRLLVRDGRPGTVYNVCAGAPLTIAEGLDMLLAAARRPLTVRTDPDRLRPSDTPHIVGDGTRLRETTGWAPQHDIADTLGELLETARKELA